jgi:hypothetical protein
MKKGAKNIFLLIIIILIIAVGTVRLIPKKLRTPAASPPTAAPSTSDNLTNTNSIIAKNMKLTSPVFSDNGVLPEKYGCHGIDINPPLEISDVPAAAKSLALVIDDPDAPGGSFIHWLVFNINPATASIAENSAPAEAVVGINSFGANNYGGPCPPSGTHRYVFKLYALDSALNLDAQSNVKKIISAMNGHVLEQTELIGAYSH